MGMRRFQGHEQEQLLAGLTERALEHDKPTLPLQMASEHLKHQQMLRPGVTVVERLMATARHKPFQRLQPPLRPVCCAFTRLASRHKSLGKPPRPL
jgi:uncharacterized protein DUF4158